MMICKGYDTLEYSVNLNALINGGNSKVLKTLFSLFKKVNVDQM